MTSQKFKQTEIGEIPEDWEVEKLGNSLKLNYGKSLPESERKFGKIPVFGSNGITGFHNEFLVKGPGIIVGRKGSVGEIKFCKDNFWPIDTTYYLTEKDTPLDLIFLYYKLLTLRINKMNSHAAVPGLNRESVYIIETNIPPLQEQTAIASILSSLDAKIELNNKMNKTLESIGQAVFKKWFIEGVGAKFGEIIDNFDSKRVPLSSLERSKKKGAFPYHGATGVLDYVDDFLFDGNYILMGEDGSVINKNGTPVLQYVRGKFWVNNHAHVIRARESFYNEFIYLLLSSTNVSQIVTGAVQPKINQQNMNNLEIVIPPEKVLNKFKKPLQNIFELIYKNKKQNQNLSQIRDTLLPKLMSGEVRVR